MKIITFAEKLKIVNQPPKTSVATVMDFVREVYYHIRMDRQGVTLGSPDDLGAVVALARVNQSRWIADCPAEQCHGSEYVDMDNKIFMCCGCWNSMYDNKWLRVQVPNDRQKLEEVLLLRPVRFRNWFPDETLEDQIKENVKRGLEVPE